MDENAPNIEVLEGTKPPETSQTMRLTPNKGSKQAASQSVVDDNKSEPIKKDVMPVAPGKKVTFDQGEKWCKQLSPENWSHTQGYLYRLHPAIIQKQVDPEAHKYIDIISEEAVGQGLRKYILTNHGGGIYGFIFNDTNTKGYNRTMVEFRLDIPLDEALPIVDLRVVDWQNPKNMGYKNVMIANGVINEKGERMASTAQQTQQQVSQDSAQTINAMSGMFDKFMGMYAKLDSDKQATINKILSGDGKQDNGKGITELFIEKLKQDDPNKSMVMITTLITAMQSMIPKPTDNGLNITTILQMNADARKETLEMLKLILDGNKPNKDEGDFFEKLIRYKTAFPEMFGGKAPIIPEKSNTEIIVDAVKEIGLPVLGLASQFIQMRGGPAPIVPVTPEQAQQMVSGMGQVPNAMTQPQNIPKVITMPNPHPQSTQSTMSTQSNAPQVDADGIPLCPDPINLSPIVWKFMMQYGMMIENAIKQGMDGVQVADSIKSLTPMVGQDIYALLKAQGKDKILSTMKAVTIFWDRVKGAYGEEFMLQFVDDFVNAEEIIASEEANENSTNTGVKE